MAFKSICLCLCVAQVLKGTSAQLDLPSMPGPPYPDPRGQNRWGVKFDPKVHGPPFDKLKEALKASYPRSHQPIQTQEQGSYQRPLLPLIATHQSQSQEIGFQRPPPPYSPNDISYSSYGSQNSIPNAPAGFSQSPNGGYNGNYKNNFGQQSQQYNQQVGKPGQFTNQQFYNAWNAQYNKNNNNNNYNNNYNYNKAIRPPTALDSGTKSKALVKEENYWNRIMGLFITKGNNDKLRHNENHPESQVQPTNFNYQVDFNYPKSPQQHWRNSKARPALLIARPKGPPRNNKRRKPKRKPQNWRIFTTIGKGLDAVNGGVNGVRKVVQGSTGRAIATGVKIGGKVAYVGAQTLAKVITKASSW